MDDITQRIEKSLGCKVNKITKLEYVTNNYVYDVVVSDDSYIFKVYRNKFWPENGKLSFVNSLLISHNIPCAELIEFNREDLGFPNGFLLEKKLQGICAEQMNFNEAVEINFYVKLAELISSIHKIPIQNFGYIGYGKADYESMVSFFKDEFDNRMNTLIEKGIYDRTRLGNMKSLFFVGLNKFDNLPSVLCHGDLSTKNVIISTNGDLALIDWDDAMSYNWMADISRLTFWMKMNYSEKTYVTLKKTFIEHYDTIYRKSEFGEFEKSFHIYIAMDFLYFYKEIGDKVMQDKILNYLDSLVS
jgi:aminoglycoside phosphotransferase (APT) family kinase protein